MIELSRNVVETKCENAKSVDLVNDLDKELENVWSVEMLARVSLEMASAHIKSFEAQVKDADEKYVKMVDETAQAEKDPCSGIFSLDSSLKAKRDRVDKVVEDGIVHVDWFKE